MYYWIIILFFTITGYAEEYFASYAYSPAKGNYGFSYNYPDAGAAEHRALSECEERAKSGDCRILRTFNNVCAALAKTSHSFVSATSNSEFGAELATLDQCAHEQVCELKKIICTAGDF